MYAGRHKNKLKVLLTFQFFLYCNFDKIVNFGVCFETLLICIILKFVFQVLSGDTVVLRNLTSKGGPPKERTLSLSSIVAPKLARRPNQNNEGGTKDEVIFFISNFKHFYKNFCDRSFN